MRHLDRVYQWLHRPIESVAGDQRGVTALKTAIILTAFVVAASVFAFTAR